ncbi:hypothetical protein N7533_013572 [Penicillium manginii]|uniref:uncharacterized protein n=1 Tax=Penicillium manginii TaxID=203109 RepID=UPI0025490376|nr:uncharacterized protein N7533_013572 [Penicillium manginii]KAJ5733125.1 hypothetical protein N7533_013572 [Penicillium manginii]
MELDAISPHSAQYEKARPQDGNDLTQTTQIRLHERPNNAFDQTMEPNELGQAQTQPSGLYPKDSHKTSQESSSQTEVSRFIPLSNYPAESPIFEHRATSGGVNLCNDVEGRPPRSLGHILDPASHYGKLERLEVDTADMCGMGSGPDLEELCESEYINMINNSADAVRRLRSEGLCGDQFSILVETSPCSNIAKVIHVSLHDIELLTSSCSQGSLGETLTRVLSIGLVSFSGSHVCAFDVNLWGRSLESIYVGFGYSYRPRKLACLDKYLKGPCWVLGTTGDGFNEGSLKISLRLQDLQELWGPVQLVGGTPMKAPLLRTQRGFIVPLPKEYQSSPHGINCHWTEDVPDYVEEQDHIWLDNTSLIIIGTDTKSHAVITVNPRCKSKIPRVEERVSYNFGYLGTRKNYSTMEGYNVSAGMGYGGSGVGVSQTFRRRNEVTLKDNIIWQFQQSYPDFEEFLHLQVGLEISLCTGNARRLYDFIISKGEALIQRDVNIQLQIQNAPDHAGSGNIVIH